MEYLQSSDTIPCGKEMVVNRRENVFVLWILLTVVPHGKKQEKVYVVLFSNERFKTGCKVVWKR